MEAVNNSDLKDVKVKSFGYDDCFVKHGSIKEIEKKCGLDADSVVENILKLN